MTNNLQILADKLAKLMLKPTISANSPKPCSIVSGLCSSQTLSFL